MDNIQDQYIKKVFKEITEYEAIIPISKKKICPEKFEDFFD